MNTNITPPIARILRVIRLLFHVASGILQSIVYPYFSNAVQQRMMKNWAAGILRILNIQLHYKNTLSDTKPVLFVANHISWLDICLIMAMQPTQFVAKSEIRNWPVIGFLCRRVGTLFIKRAKQRDIVRINQEISEALATGEYVCIFPEGGTSDGTQTHHFHASLLQSAVSADAIIYPIAIRYLDHTGAICHDAAYTDISLLTSLRQILRQPCIEGVLNCGEPIHSAGKNRRELARLSEEAITQCLSQPAYHNATEKPAYLPNA